MSVSEALLYGGIFLMLLSAVGGVCAAVILRLTGGHLRQMLDMEYGPDPMK